MNRSPHVHQIKLLMPFTENTARQVSPVTSSLDSIACRMASLLDHGLIRTRAVERVVAPIASHICHLVLVCDSDEDPARFSHLEEAAQTVAKATDELAAAAARYVEPRVTDMHKRL